MPNIIYFNLSIPYWVNFRVPTAINFILSFSVPPPTTIYGLIMNSLGKFQNDYTFYDKIKIAIQINDYGQKTWDTVSYMKTADRKSMIVKNKEIKQIQDGDQKLFEDKIRELNENYGLSIQEAENLINKQSSIYKSDFQGVFYTQALQCERILNPNYKVYLLIEDDNLTDNIYASLKNPKRPLYLGQSDDFVIIKNINIIRNPKEQNLKKISTIYRGIIENSEIVKLPEYFKKRGRTIKCFKANYSLFKGVRDLPSEEQGYIVENNYVIFN
ncbi:MAG: CRISPR-associated protein Cas5 [Candidatus Lokiarchaeota archaeon]|nr:CRISPR-associated protein Cas5 [Candidatus Lokiarchaeota archaeon]